MTISVHKVCTLPASGSLNIGAAPSITRVAHPLATSANHILGELLGGMRCCQRGAGAQSGTGILRFKMHRHPNCGHLDMHVKLMDWAQQANWQIAGQAGSGRVVSFSDGLDVDAAEGAGEYRIRPPWADGDTGVRDVTITTTNVSLRMLAINDVPRETLTATDGDHCVERVDSTYPAIGFLPERAIANSSEAGPPALVDQIVNAWDDYRPQLVAWSTWESEPRSISAASYGGSGSTSDIFAGLEILAKNRRKTSSVTRDIIDVQVYVAAVGYSGELRVTAVNPGGGANDSDTVVVGMGAEGWFEMQVKMDCTTEGYLVFEAKVTGPGTLNVTSVCATGSG